MRIKSLLSILLFAVVIILLTPFSVSKGCAHIEPFEGYSFINPNIGETASFKNYLLSFKSLYEQDIEANNQQEKDNITEWRESVCEVATTEDVAHVVYKASKEAIDTLIKIAEGEALTTDLMQNTFAEFLVDKNCIETLEYLAFAKSCEPHVIVRYYWGDDQKDVTVMRQLLKQGRKKMKSLRNSYIKLRYAYQIIRLAHYLGEFKMAVKLYDKYIPKLTKKGNSIIFNWATAHKAGALKSMKKVGEAAYLFSRVFEESPSKREPAFRSFEINDQATWQATKKFCKNEVEEANLYFMRGLQSSSVATEEMESIYQLVPNSPKLEFLLIREIQILEKDYLGREFIQRDEWEKEYLGYPREEADEYILEIGEFVTQVVKEGKVENKDFWRMCEGYLEYLAGELPTAKKMFAAVKSTTKDAGLKSQIEGFEVALQVSEFKTMNDKNEAIAYQLLTQHQSVLKRNESFENFIYDRLNFLYKKQKDPAKVFLTGGNLSDVKYNSDKEMVTALLAFSEKPDKNKFEKFLMTKANGQNFEHTLIEMKATYLLGENKLEEALVEFEKLPKTWEYERQYAAFEEWTKDCIECKLPKTADLYNKKELTERLIALEKAVTDNPLAADHFQLGLAYYNITYFGNAWHATDYFRPYGAYTPSQWYDSSAENYNIEPALKHLEKAVELAGSDKELAAKAAFWAAKCELVLFYRSPLSKSYAPWDNEVPNIPTARKTYYNQLINNYSDTEYYKAVIKDCAFLYAYAL